VDALGGEPGVHSKRYAGENKTDAQRIQFLLNKLRDLPRGQRRARFRCAIVIAEANGKTWTSEGTCEGEIIFEPRGTNGFGYDPIFLLPERGLTMAELSPEAKNQVSHRARAAERARKILAKF
jgi:XTP/dITP diphosphohydrolase